MGKVFRKRGESYNPVRERKAFLALFLVSLHPLESPEDRVILGANRGLEEVQVRRDLKILLVFSVTPFKIDQNKNQNRSIDKVQNLENDRS